MIPWMILWAKYLKSFKYSSKMSEQPSHVDRFFGNMLEISNFIYDLIFRLNVKGYKVVNPQIVKIGAELLKGYNKVDLLENFIKYSEKFWTEIKSKNEEFINNNVALIFSNLPAEHVKAFQEIFSTKDTSGNLVVDSIDRETLWKFFHSYVKIAIKYIHDRRGPYSREEVCRYSTKYLPDIDLQKHALLWNVKLFFPKEK
jgi:hypothetical protein